MIGSGGGAATVAVRVLGPVRVESSGSEVRLASPKARALLALLALAEGRSVAPESLIGGIWGAERPRHPGSALQVVVSRLRSRLAECGVGLDHSDAGYALGPPCCDSDAGRARLLVDAARSAFEAGDVHASASAAEAGLALWAGSPLADVTEFPFASEAIRRLDALRLDLVGLRNRAFLRLGRFAEILTDIEVWIALDPWRERLRTQQMLALHAEGRSVEAVAVYTEFRNALVEHFGMEPSYDCRELHRAILKDDPAIVQALDSFRRLHEESEGGAPGGDDGLADAAIRLVWAAQSLVGASGVSVLGAEGDERTWLVVESRGAAAVALRLATGGRIVDDTFVAEALRATGPAVAEGDSAPPAEVAAEAP